MRKISIWHASLIIAYFLTWTFIYVFFFLYIAVVFVNFREMKKSTLDIVAIFLAELIGTALLVLFGCMGCVNGLGNIPKHFELCFNFGLVVMIVIQIFGCVSGSHINPAVTVAAYFYDMVTLPIAGLYIVAQLIGGFMGFGILKLVTPAKQFERVNEDSVGFCSTVPHPDITAFQAVAVEFLATMVLILVCCGVWDPRNAKHHDSVPIRFGLAVACLAVAAGPYTGASMNPARTLGPALWNNEYTMHWVYWIGPLTAAVVTSLTYKLVFRREAPNTIVAHEEIPLRDKSNA